MNVEKSLNTVCLIIAIIKEPPVFMMFHTVKYTHGSGNMTRMEKPVLQIIVDDTKQTKKLMSLNGSAGKICGSSGNWKKKIWW